MDALIQAIIQAIVPVGGAIAVLLFAGLVYQSWQLMLERQARDADRQQAIAEAGERSAAMTKLALASDGLAQTLSRIEASLSAMAITVARLDGAMGHRER
jgi:hypothetical protein